MSEHAGTYGFFLRHPLFVFVCTREKNEMVTVGGQVVLSIAIQT